MTQLEKDIEWLKKKYGDTYAIKCAETIMRVVNFADKHKGLYNGNDKKRKNQGAVPVSDVQNNIYDNGRTPAGKSSKSVAEILRDVQDERAKRRARRKLHEE